MSCKRRARTYKLLLMSDTERGRDGRLGRRRSGAEAQAPPTLSSVLINDDYIL